MIGVAVQKWVRGIYTDFKIIQSPDGTPDGTGNGWTVQEFQDQSETPGGYQDAFEELDISLDADNHFRYCSQNLPFSNCNSNDLVGALSPFLHPKLRKLPNHGYWKYMLTR